MRNIRTIINVFAITVVLLFSSCATIISGSRQTVRISSEPRSATVFINEIEVGKTPLEKSLKRNQEYQVLIKLDGYQPYETLLTKKFNAWYIGNILFGGLIGIIIDPITGAMYKLSPEEINANLNNKTAFKTKGKDIYLSVNMTIDLSWEKIGQLKKLE